MAKSSAIKFPRISAGFYGITKDGEFVGYVMKDTDLDGKETNWYVFDDNVQGKDVAMLHPKNAIERPDSLLREAKDSAKKYFLNRPATLQAPPETITLNKAEWVEVDEPSESDLLSEDEIDGDDVFVPMAQDFVEFDSQLDPFISDEFDNDDSNEDEFSEHFATV